MVTPKEFWNMRSENYDSGAGMVYAQVNRETAELSLKYLKPTDRVLEFACGTGAITVHVAPHVSSVRAIDISNEMVTKAQVKFQEQGLTNVELSQTDIFDPCLEEGSFDAVLAYNVLCYLPDRKEVLERLRRLVKQGGMFLSATDCLGEKLTKVGLKKFWMSHTGSMPYVAFDTMKQLEGAVSAAGFTVLERKNLYPAPPNLFIAAQKN